MINKIRRQISDLPSQADYDLLTQAVATTKELGAIMGILQENAGEYLAAKKSAMLAQIAISEEDIQKLILERKQAREAKNWSRGDEIRDQLLEHNIELNDSAEGTGWSIKKNWYGE